MLSGHQTMKVATILFAATTFIISDTAYADEQSQEQEDFLSISQFRLMASTCRTFKDCGTTGDDLSDHYYECIEGYCSTSTLHYCKSGFSGDCPHSISCVGGYCGCLSLNS